MNNMVKYFLIALALGMTITVIEQSVKPVISEASAEPDTRFGTIPQLYEFEEPEEPSSLFGSAFLAQANNENNTVSMIEFINYYDQPNYTDVKKFERRRMALESMGDKKLYVESAKVKNLSNIGNKYRLWATIDWTIEQRTEIRIACIYHSEMPPQHVIDLNIDDIISVTGKYSKKELGTILLTDCTVVPHEKEE